jgi:serine phosphatase RsbU (regulator of sigma subunit)
MIGPAQLGRVTALLLVTAAAFAIRATIEGDPGPLFIVPTLVAAYWWGRIGGLIAGVGVTAAFMTARGLNPAGSEGPLLAAAGFRLAVYCAAGYAVGWVVEDRRRLRAQVDESRRHMAELRDLQEALAPPDMPSRPELELASCYVPAEGGAGGDFFLVAPGPQDATVVVVGDVAGKGLQAAKRAAYVRMAFAAAAPFQDDPCKLLAIANTNLIERAGVSDIFVTAACIVVRPSENKIAWAVAGHPPPLLLNGGSMLNDVKAAFPLGIGDDIDCEMGEIELEPGGGFVAFTDGLIEARRGGDLFGMERLSELLATLDGSDPSAVVSELRSAAERYAGGTLSDDLCMVAVRSQREPVAA